MAQAPVGLLYHCVRPTLGVGFRLDCVVFRYIVLLYVCRAQLPHVNGPSEQMARREAHPLECS